MEKNCMMPESTISAMASLGLNNPQDVWNLAENTRIFLEALRLFFETREKDIGNLIFDKDDQLAVELVTAAANIRASSFGIPLHSLFEAKGIAGNIVHAVATTNAIIAGLIVVEAIKVLRSDFQNCRMTYCLEHPSRKLLLMPVEPFEPNKSCYVCSKTPLLLEVNTHKSKLRDFVEKIVKKKLGMNLPLIMHGNYLIFEEGDDLDEIEAATYASNLDKVLAELPGRVISGTELIVEDLQQELSCKINIKHREEFDEENDDEMVLSGWKAAEAVAATKQNPAEISEANGEVEVEIAAGKPETVCATKRSDSEECETDCNQESDEVEIARGNPEDVGGTKRKLSERLNPVTCSNPTIIGQGERLNPVTCSNPTILTPTIIGQGEQLNPVTCSNPTIIGQGNGQGNDDGDDVVLLDENPGTMKKKKLQ